MDINLRVVFQLCQLLGRPMLERDQGKIVDLASLLSFRGGSTVPAFAASKGGVAKLTKALRNEWSSQGVHVNAVAPGIHGHGHRTAARSRAPRADRRTHPGGVLGQPEEIGNVVVFLASPAAAYVHGQVLAVGGGWMAR